MASESSYRDANNTPTMMGVNGSGELRRVVVGDAGGLTVSGVVDTELPAAAALADGSTPLLSTTKVGVVPFARTGTSTSDILRTPNVFKPLDAVSIAAEATIWDPAAGKKFRLMGYHLSSSVAGNVLLKDNTAGTTIAVIPAGAGGGGSVVDLGNGILSGTADNLLTATGPALSTLSGVVWGIEE